MLLPVAIETRRTRDSRITLTLIFLNAAAYFLCVLQGFAGAGASLQGVRALPEASLRMWALVPDLPSPWSCLTAPWVHVSLLHLAGNLLFLWVFGAAAEEAMGRATFLGVYLIGGLVSTLTEYGVALAGLAPADRPYAGASGAVIAVIVAFAVRRYRDRVRLWLLFVELSAPALLLILLCLAWYGASPWLLAAPEIAPNYWGHLAGAATGLLLALVLRMGARGQTDYSLDDALKKVHSGNLRDGLEELEAIQRLSPLDSRIPLVIARAYLDVWDRALAARYYAQAIGVEIKLRHTAAALKIWEEAASRETPLPPQCALSLAAALADADSRQDAIRLYEFAAASSDPGSAAIARKRLEKLG